MSFDPNHPPELRWGAPMGSEERASAPQTYTPTPSGIKVAMEDAYRLQAFYRSLCQRETDQSYLRKMFTSGYPIRAKLDAQVGKWDYATQPLLAGPGDSPGNTAPEEVQADKGIAETSVPAPDAAPPAEKSGTAPPTLLPRARRVRSRPTSRIHH